jgi:hypothetical protein
MKYNYNFGFLFGLKSVSVSVSVSVIIVFLSVLSVLIYWFYKYLMKSCSKEGFKEGFNNVGEGIKWSNDLINRFNIYQNTMTDNAFRYNLEVLQKNASPEEAETLLKTGYWPWSGDTKYIYMDSLWHQPIIKTNVNQALDYAMKTHNETAAKQLLSWKTKEGQFLLYGGKGVDAKGTYNKGAGNKFDTIKCTSDENNNSHVVGVIKNNFTDDYIENSERIADADIPVNMPGFNFVKGPCNPCVAIRNDYSCPFRLNVGGDDSISPIWKKLWGI